MERQKGILNRKGWYVLGGIIVLIICFIYRVCSKNLVYIIIYPQILLDFFFRKKYSDAIIFTILCKKTHI